MWIPSLLRVTESGSNGVVAVWVTLGLTLLNSLLTTHYFYKGKETNLPSPFVGSTYWFAMSAIPAMHTCWQAQLVLVGISLTILTLLKTDFHHEATEEAFLATLICCFFAPMQSIMITGVMMIWGYLLFKGIMTWRVWFASLIAIAVRIILMVGLHYLGWLKGLWLENIPHLTGIQWGICGVIFLFTATMILLPLRKPSVASGTIYLALSILLTAAGGLCVYNNVLTFIN